MSTANIDNGRATKLVQLFNGVLQGRKPLGSSREGNLFIQGICIQTDVATTAYKLVSSSHGLKALQTAVRFDTSVAFLNDGATLLLSYLQNPELKTINSGAVLQQILRPLVDPPYFWEALTKAFLAQLLKIETARSFAWLLLELCQLPGKLAGPYLAFAASPAVLNDLLGADDGHTRILGEKIKHFLPLQSTGSQDPDGHAGGRHDNDHQNYKDIRIMPTADELLSKDRPFLRTSDYLIESTIHHVETDSLPALHVDNQFRLLREDMLGEIRDEIKVLLRQKSGHHKGTVITGLQVTAIDVGTQQKRISWGITFKCKDGVPQLKNISTAKKRLDYLKNNRQMLRQGNMSCLLVDDEPVAFPTILRKDDELAAETPALTLQFRDSTTLDYTLTKLKASHDVRLAQLDTATFAFEPFLARLQCMNNVPLSTELFCTAGDESLAGPSFRPDKILRALREKAGKDIQDVLKTNKSIILDEAQMNSLLSCLCQRVSLVQGPPGTGKSFIGALAAQILYKATKEKILVVCFTNHALDQFLEDLMDIGIPQSSMVRLGGKSTERTRPLMLKEHGKTHLKGIQWAEVDRLKQRLEDQENKLQDSFKRYRNTNISKRQLLEYLEFMDDDLQFFEALKVPDAADGMQVMGKNNRKVDEFYLLDRWVRGNDAGVFKDKFSRNSEFSKVWSFDRDQRQTMRRRWENDILKDLVSEICRDGEAFNEIQSELQDIFAKRDFGTIQNARIIACTTNGAAKYASAIHSASPGVVLVEEAGEILEAHILTSLGPQTEQLIMIGDHKQLRPKCSYELSVENGEGFDLNRSLFERLILKGYPHHVLSKQHRMRPEISSMIRHLTYPELTDAPGTLNRPNLRGFSDNIIFVNHSSPEKELSRAIELRDGRSSSKQNEFEGQMILKCVKYLAQQGYGSDKIVVLTPYLGQLKLLREQLATENDPVLNDLDTFDLVRAGLLTDLNSKTTKPSLRLSTIDNYQGEECEIVLVSLTRSNKSHDIGFMAQPERVNVMLSRARNALIIIGNSDTFINARKGKEVWCKLFDHLKLHDHVYDGFPTKCERHPSRAAKLASPSDFEQFCPDGGCQEPCGAMLSCGLHKCPSACHQLFDHSKIECLAVLSRKCESGHEIKWKCHAGPSSTCHKCENEKKEIARKAQKILETQRRRDEQLQKHQLELAKLDEEFRLITESNQDRQILDRQQNILNQKRKDIENAKQRLLQQPNDTAPGNASPPNSSNPKASQNSVSKSPDGSNIPTRQSEPVSVPLPRTSSPQQQKANSLKSLQAHIKSVVTHNSSPSQTEWQRQKDQENALNPAIDEIMSMIGLESVKEKVLQIKARVETAVRQGTDLKKERLGLVLLGNPGTGKTTVARHYASVLSSLKVLDGTGFVETTGSRLAHGGVKEVKDHLSELMKLEGGVYFIDEAYQLAEGHNIGGKMVLDYILAEIENLIGRVVFVFAGYNKQMEKFFEHNPGFASRLPYRLIFDDYKDSELLTMLQAKIAKFYQPDPKIEDGPDGLFMNIAIRKLGRGRGKDGFGNARDLENVFQKIRDRQSVRLHKERQQGLTPDDFYFSREDLIGPDPSVAIQSCDAWNDLQGLTGLKEVKDSVQALIDLIATNYQRELKNLKLVTTTLNRVFLGSPGTGKTTVAKLFGQILAHIGVLSNGEVVIKCPADFIGAVIGESEQKTKAILATTVGKVLIIDEAYMLYSAASKIDPFREAVIDTIVAEVQNVPGDDRCVLLCGYQQQMEVMFQNVNPGLARRFQLKEAFHFADFTDDELEQILRMKLKFGDLGATSDAISTAIDVLSRARNGLNFGNGGDVENIISKAKMNYQARQSLLPHADRSIDFCFEPQDFDPDYNRAEHGETNLETLFQGVIGCDAIVSMLRGFLTFAKGLKANNKNPRELIPMNFVFKGPPGTGKTTTARKFGQVFYDLGLLSEVEVVECSATDLVGQYIGQTGPKTLAVMEKGLGKVLFIDEAYRLAGGHFAQEAMDELVGLMTQDRFRSKMIIILAGYDGDMDRLLEVNQGLRSRFSDDVFFHALKPFECLQVLWSNLEKNKIVTPILDVKNAQIIELQERFRLLASLPGWGNARDIETLAKRMIKIVYSKSSPATKLSISVTTMITCVEEMLTQKQSKSKYGLPARIPTSQSGPLAPPETQTPPETKVNTATSTREEPRSYTPEPESDEDDVESISSATSETSADPKDDRDPGVSDQDWTQLQQNMAAERRLEEYNQGIAKQLDQIRRDVAAMLARIQDDLDKQRLEDEKLTREREESQRLENERIKAILAALQAAEDAKNEELRIQAEKAAAAHRAAVAKREAEEQQKLMELMRLREMERLQQARERDEKERERRRLEKQMRQIQENQKKEAAAQSKLRHMGVCSAGYRWIKQPDGYRCAGGFHFVSNGQLGM